MIEYLQIYAILTYLIMFVWLLYLIMLILTYFLLYLELCKNTLNNKIVPSFFINY